MRNRDRERLEWLARQDVGEVCGKIELADRLLDPDLPDARGAERDQVLGSRDHLAARLGEFGIVGEPPEEGMRVEQDPHGSIPNAAAMSAGNSSKSSWILIRPFRAPGVRLAAAPV